MLKAEMPSNYEGILQLKKICILTAEMPNNDNKDSLVITKVSCN